MSGGFDPAPFKFGAQAGHREELILESLLEADGTAFSKERESIVWAERLAEARCLAYLWSLNRRMTLQRDPLRMTDFLPRWERILGIVPPPDFTPKRRRETIRSRFATEGLVPDSSTVIAALKSALDGAFVEVVHIASNGSAVGSVPGGAVVPGGVTLPDGDFYSTIATILVKVSKPANMTTSVFYAFVNETTTALDDLVPAWCVFDWFVVSGSGSGFFLDDEANLDNELFDV